jgi:hypothetical protein
MLQRSKLPPRDIRKFKLIQKANFDSMADIGLNPIELPTRLIPCEGFAR